MIFDDPNLRKIDQAYIDSLDDIEIAKKLASKLLEDLKEAREKLNENPHNSSRPPSSAEPWVVAQIEEDTGKQEESDPGNEGDSSDSSDEKEADAKKRNRKKGGSRKPGKQKEAEGKGRTQKLSVTGTVIHFAQQCPICDQELTESDFTACTGHYVIDIVMGKEDQPGITLTNTLHIYGDTACACGYVSHTVAHRCAKEEEWDVELTEWHLVGPMLMSLICCLAMRMRLSRRRIGEFLDDWLHLRLSTGTINQCIHEAGRACEPVVEKQLLQELRRASLLQADETSWKQNGKPYWMWVFITVSTVLLIISRRTKETVKRILGDFDGWLMSDGYIAYRDYPKRLRCWAHLQRKGEGLAESLNRKAQEFGEIVLSVLKTLMDAVYDARTRASPAEDLKAKYQRLLEKFRFVCEEYKYFAFQKNGKIYEKTQALAREFLNDWEAIFRVLEHPHLPLTNNEAERILRHWVILRRLCYGTRTKQGSRAVGLLASAIETCRLRKVSPWEYLAETIAERRKGLSPHAIPEPAR
ncbi:MAG: IS66 family transposase [Candidatus Marinimicrobia bacterium]|nr:IS66 family transposase [Candidatus Neomarinimicrobiota bacterium]